MAILFTDSFDHYAQGDIGKKWDGAYSPNYIKILPNGRFGNGLSYGTSSPYVDKTFPQQQTVIVGFACKLTEQTTSDSAILSFRDTGGAQVTIDITTGMQIQVLRSSNTLLATSVGPIIDLNTWFYIEVKVKIDEAPNGTYEVRINGQNVLSGTGDTRYSSTNSWVDRVRLHASYFYPIFDDFYLCDTTGAVNNDFLGDVRVEALMPNAEGTYSDWSRTGGATNYEVLDDNPPDSDTSYISSMTTDAKTTVNMANSQYAGGEIKGIQVLAYAKKDDANTKLVAPIIRENGVNTEGTAVSVGNDYAYIRHIFDRRPSDNQAWTIADVNALEAGVVIKG